MKKKEFHVVFGRMAKGTLTHSQVLDSEKTELICLEDILHIGPVCDLDCPEDIAKRKKWFLDTFGSEHFTEKLISDMVENDLEAIRSIIQSSNTFDKIYLWTGYGADEVSTAARLVFHIAARCLKKEIFRMDFPNIPVQIWNGDISYPNSLTVVAKDQVPAMMKRFYPLEEKDILAYRQAWENIRKADSLLRVCGKHGRLIEHADVACFDPLLEHHCTEEFQCAARVIGHTLCDIDFGVGDSYLNWRLKQLILSGKLEGRGQLAEIRDYEVKNKQ